MAKINNTLHTRVIIAGGGTGGHIFPALAIAKQLQEQNPFVELLFIGSKYRMEMQKIPEAGYEIRGLDIRGLERRKWWRNIFVIFKLIKSFFVVHKILQEFQPQVVVGVGGYSSFAVLFMAQLWRIPTLIQEQNSYAGLSNRLLGKYASTICLGYRDVARFFPQATSIYTGNPVRQDLLKIANIQGKSAKLAKRFGLSLSKPTILIIGGSLGSGILNNFVLRHLRELQDFQLIWQCGSGQYRKIASKVRDYPNIYATDFLEDMASVYQLADVVISRAGALAVAEIATLRKPAIFVPWPKSTGNHQYYNALSLVEAGAALMVSESELKTELYPKLCELLANESLQNQLRTNLSSFRSLQATEIITNQVFKLAERLASPLSKVYMLGIGGAGMQALARYLHEQGVEVAGYDREKSRYTKILQDLGIKIDYQEKPELIAQDVDWVIYTPAIQANSPIMKYCKAQKIPLLKRSFVLGQITRNSHNICIAGTHGKTSTCALFACIAKAACYNVQEFIGGALIPDNIRAPQIYSQANSYQLNIIEADEYDKSFLTLSPYLAVITSMDSDHLEVYGSQHKMWQAYYDFARKLAPSGALIVPFSLSETHDFGVDNLLTYSISDARATIFAKDIQYQQDHSVQFEVFLNGILYSKITLPQGTDFNIENALAAILLASVLEIPKTVIRDALSLYSGVRCRFELLYDNGKVCYIHDYAHHPRELESCILSLAKRYPNKRKLLIFQPHLYSRTQYFYTEFARVLDLAKAEVLLLPIDPAREEAIEGVDSGLIARAMRGKKQVLTVEECLQWVEKNNCWEVIVGVGAGKDLEKVAQGIISHLKLNYV